MFGFWIGFFGNFLYCLFFLFSYFFKKFSGNNGNGKKNPAEGRSPPQELEVGPHSGLYRLVVPKTY